jgi:hypothetical protein
MKFNQRFGSVSVSFWKLAIFGCIGESFLLAFPLCFSHVMARKSSNVSLNLIIQQLFFPPSLHLCLKKRFSPSQQLHRFGIVAIRQPTTLPFSDASFISLSVFSSPFFD